MRPGWVPGATLMLYDGSPFAPQTVLWDFAQAERINVFGTSAKYIDACKKAKLEPARTHDLSALRLITVTGSPLAADDFDYVDAKVKSDVHLASISGGTDIVSCFVLGVPTAPVWRGETSGRDWAWRWTCGRRTASPGAASRRGTRLHQTVSVSCRWMFWSDPEGLKYRAAYFERFPGVCATEISPSGAHGGIIIHGRSDATLNSGGVRIGTADIYRASRRRFRR